jgi:EmrB/QacA subfamily drug resistance transporter
VLAVASIGVFMAFVDATIVNIAFPSIERSFPQAGISGVSWVLSAYNIVFAAFLVAAGRFSDLLGRRRVFVFSVALFTVASVLCAIAPSAGALVAARVVQALGAAFLIPSSLALVLASFDRGHQSHAVALWTAVGAAAAGVGPSLGGLLISISDWRLVFLVNVPIGIVAIALAQRLLVESRAPGRRRMPDMLGALIFALATGLLVLGIVKGGDWGWSNWRVLSSWGAALVLGALFVRRCARRREPLIDLALLRIRNFSVANAATLIAAAGFFGYTLCNVLFLTEIWRYSVLQAGLALTPGPITAVIVAGPASHLAQRFGARMLAVPGGLIWGGALLWFIYRIGPVPAFTSQWLPGIVMLGVGAGAFFPTVSGAAVAAAPGHHFATSTALNSVARQVGAALGIALVVTIIGTPAPAQAVQHFHDAWWFASASLLAAGIACVGLTRAAVGAEGELPSLASATRAVLGAQAQQADAPRVRPGPRPRVVTAAAPAVPRDRAETAADFLANVPLFASLGEELLAQLAEHARNVHLEAGAWLFREGERADSIYVVRGGRLEVIDPDGAAIRVAGRGTALGELALLTSSPRSASVRAARASEVLAIDRASFEGLLETSPELSRALLGILAGQLRMSGGALEAARPRPVTIALLALHPGLPLPAIAHELAAALGDTTAVLDGSEASVDGDTHATAVYGPLLDRCERANGRVVLCAAELGAAWGHFAMQESDRVLAIAAHAPPPGTEVPAELHRCELVLWDVTAGSRAAEGWGELLEPIETHALSPGHALRAGAERMARRLTGRSVGVVLSGGGARAFAHIGVLEELDNAGIVIDRVAGVSMGAYIGGLLAMGLDARAIDACCYEDWVRHRPLRDYTFPRHSLIRGERVRAMLDRTFGEVAIEELERSFFCASSDLRTAELVLHRHGLLREHIGTSMALPVIGPPQVREQRILVDGSLIDNLPVDAMALLGEGPVIAVDIRAGRGGGTGSWQQRRELRTPALGETLMRVLLLASSNTSQAARRYADLVIEPVDQGVGLLEFHQLDAAREAGREAARAALVNAPDSLFP